MIIKLLYAAGNSPCSVSQAPVVQSPSTLASASVAQAIAPTSAIASRNSLRDMMRRATMPSILSPSNSLDHVSSAADEHNMAIPTLSWDNNVASPFDNLRSNAGEFHYYFIIPSLTMLHI